MIDARLDDLMPLLGRAFAEIEREERKAIDDRIAKSEEAALQLIMELQQRITDLEQSAIRKSKPKLVAGGPDAA